MLHLQHWQSGWEASADLRRTKRTEGEVLLKGFWKQGTITCRRLNLAPLSYSDFYERWGYVLTMLKYRLTVPTENLKGSKLSHQVTLTSGGLTVYKASKDELRHNLGRLRVNTKRLQALSPNAAGSPMLCGVALYRRRL